ncbi:vWA domain-containing protein [Breznakiellaceae bacterium SP9]
MTKFRYSVLFVVIGLFFPPAMVAAGGQQQAGASANRGNYLSGMGYIVQPKEIFIDSYIAQVDYDYPLPDRDPINIITAADIKGDTAYLQIGLKARKIAFDALPPLNIAFVIDKSGSMTESDKMDWVKDSFRVFADQVRPQDFISLVVFDTVAEVLIPSARIRNYQDKQAFIQTVNTIRAVGGTNVYDGMQLGYRQVAANFSREYINRVICLTDGEHNSGGMGNADIINLAEKYNKQDINISTIALGASADIPLMVDVATKGGGSSRFISDHDMMVKTFGSELDRLLVPAARMLKMDLALSEGVRLKETWGYENSVSGSTIHYTLDTIHNGDYETIVAEVAVNLRGNMTAPIPLGSFMLEYIDPSGRPQKTASYPLALNGAALEDTASINEPRVKEAEGFIVLGRGLIDLGKTAQNINTMQQEYNNLRARSSSASAQPASRNDGLLRLNDVPAQSEAARMRSRIIGELDNALQKIDGLSLYLLAIRNSLGGDKYKQELELLSNYRVSFSGSRDTYAQIQGD